MSGKMILASLFGRKSWKAAKGESVAVQKQSSQVSPTCVRTEATAGSECESGMHHASSTDVAVAPDHDTLANLTVSMGSLCSPGSDEKMDDVNGSSGCTTDHGVHGAEWEDRSSQDMGDAGLGLGGAHGHVLEIIESDDDEIDKDDDDESEFGQGCSLLLHDVSVKSKEHGEHKHELFHSEGLNEYEEKTDVYSPEGFHHAADSSSNLGTSEGGALSDVGCEQKEMDIDWEHSQSAQSEPMQALKHWRGTLSEEGKQTEPNQTASSKLEEGTDVPDEKSTAMVVAKEPIPSLLPGPSRVRWMKEVHVHMPLQIHGPQNWQQRLMGASAGRPMGAGQQKGGGDCSVLASAVVEDKGGDKDPVMKVTIAVETPTDATMARVQEWVNNLCGEAKYLAEHAWGPQSVLEGFEPSPQEVAAGWSDDELPSKEEASPFKHSPTRGKVGGGGEGQGGVQSEIYGAEELAAKCVGVLDRGAVTAAFPGWGLRVVPALANFHHLKRLNLSQNSIVRISSGVLPSSLHLLDLSHNSIAAIEGLKDLSRLRVLNLSHNRLTRIGHGLAGCVKLREVYLSDNKISEAEGLHRLLKLTLLDLAWNKLSSTKSLGQLAANYGTLQALNLAGNPVHINLSEDAFRKFILGLLPRLCFLNQTPLRSGALTRDMSADSLARAALANGRSTVKGRSNGGTNRMKTGVSSTCAQLGGHRTSHGGGRAGGAGKSSQTGRESRKGRTVTVSESGRRDV